MKLSINRFSLIGTIALTATSVALTVPAVKSQSPSTIKVDGSSTVFPVTAAAAEDFQKSKSGSIRVTVGVSGTGGGFKKFCRGETDISNASRPILASEIAACRQAGIQFIELPVAYDALTVVVNPGNTWAKSLTTAELKKMWEPAAQGQIKNWSQVRAGFPNAPLKLFGPGADSGTFDYFTEAVVGKSKASRGDFTGSEDDNVLVQGVARDKNALGYFGYAYYEANKKKLKAVPINGVAPSRQTVMNGTYRPLSRPIFIYVNAKAATRPDVQQFVQYYLNNAPRLVTEVKYVPLPANAYRTALGNFSKRQVGTRFGGEEAVGLRVEDLMRRQPR